MLQNNCTITFPNNGEVQVTRVILKVKLEADQAG